MCRLNYPFAQNQFLFICHYHVRCGKAPPFLFLFWKFLWFSRTMVLKLFWNFISFCGVASATSFQFGFEKSTTLIADRWWLNDLIVLEFQNLPKFKEKRVSEFFCLIWSVDDDHFGHRFYENSLVNFLKVW